MTEREAETRALAGPLWNARAEVGHRAALGADPGQQEDRARHQARASATACGCVAPTTAPTDDRPTSPIMLLAPLVDERRDVVPHRPAVGEDRVLQVAARVRGADEHEDAGSTAPDGAEERLDRVTPEPRVDGERIRARRRQPSRYASA